MNPSSEMAATAPRVAANRPDAVSTGSPALPVTRRPDPALLTYYLVSSLALGPFFFIPLIPHYFKYHTLRYTVEEEGISMRWGVLFRREVSLTYARIQDIHLSSNFIERWLGLAKIQVQTASGSATAEMTIEGLKDFGGMRDFLYGRMRGARDRGAIGGAAHGAGEGAHPDSFEALAATLQEIAGEVRGIRRALKPAGEEEAGHV